MHLNPSFDVPTSPADAAALLTRDLPRDQALGLRLLAMARAAAAMHMGEQALRGGSASVDEDAQGAERMRQLLRSQASGLIGLANAAGSPHFVRGS